MRYSGRRLAGFDNFYTGVKRRFSDKRFRRNGTGIRTGGLVEKGERGRTSVITLLIL